MQQDFSVETLPLKGAFRVRHKVFSDHRGMFKRLSCHQSLLDSGVDAQPRQVNASLTPKKGTIRGMHFQHEPATETKIVCAMSGSLFDVLIDLRPDSDTYLQWYGEQLSGESHSSLIVPPGFAHGFQTTSDNVLMMYLNSTDYAPDLESGIHPLDPSIAVAWPLPVTELSAKDSEHSFIDSTFNGISLGTFEGT
ncbi:dTDP-4-dehydrorhamnose 3,5-epimerase family protein [Echinimonas agarilytica]|uniref:dTDP-4-dehydrorhamnose 3,5-epimerase n=1 Tax=Echinimonas agarilytica TaxID=1215918 RepID=A0AA41W5E3_9GAMM|nr:dTDP-4-dehydrorhamnose 3,5-epimerase family protein [Echinimonas agarilytica]MCM2678950.1 dTDP-4-dehydrorhamnose 3,5-epimerase family protein [Echinimonas agarilytica]